MSIRASYSETSADSPADLQCAAPRPRQAPALKTRDPYRRVAIENVAPEINGGRFPIKRVPGEQVTVAADIFADGHDRIAAVLRYRPLEQEGWLQTPMLKQKNDRWEASFRVTEIGVWVYAVEAWVDLFSSWQRDLEKKSAAGQEVSVELQMPVPWLRAALEEAADDKGRQGLALALKTLEGMSDLPVAERVMRLLNPELSELMRTWAPRPHTTVSRELRVLVDPPLARFSAWYELFPRSASPEPGRHGTLRDCEALLPRIAQMGFDIVYLPPVHPIGRAFRKGKNNSLQVAAEDPGSPWAIGAEEGGHKSIHPQLGTLDDFRHLVRAARKLGLELALDIAFQCSPDHPYVREHPDWFRHRPDGSIQYAENPPKKYQDIYPLNFDTEDWRGLWMELKSVFEFWIEQGVSVFRVDNPHTKPFVFWEWCLGELKREHPELIFLSEAFTRPSVMHYLAKLGFTQSYNYFPWRNTRCELKEYFTQLTGTELREYFRPNLWPNTPDILTEYLQYGGRPALIARCVLAATLGASYGIYGPPLEAGETRPREQGSEEYLNSEKYEIRHWDFGGKGGFGELMTRVNQARRENPALHSNDSLQFHEIDNEQLLAFSKHTEDLSNIVLVVVNLDPHHRQSGWVRLQLDTWGLPPTGNYQAHELITGERYLWSGSRNYVELNPVFIPAHIFLLRRHVRTEQDFDYFI